MNYHEYLETAKSAARESGNFLRQRRDIRIDENLNRDIKLSSDKESEKIIIDKLAVSGLPVLSEERGWVSPKKEESLQWIVDPLDGSVNYFKAMDELTCVSIALFDDWEPVLGVVYRYATDEIFTGIVGEGAFLNGKAVKTSGVTQVKDAVLATGFPSARDFSSEALKHFIINAQNFKKVRMFGSASIMAVFVACGRIDAYMEEDIRLWDVAAAAAIVTAAGGVADLRVKNAAGYRCLFSCFASNNLKEDYETQKRNSDV